jgi:hypothetical protein
MRSGFTLCRRIPMCGFCALRRKLALLGGEPLLGRLSMQPRAGAMCSGFSMFSCARVSVRGRIAMCCGPGLPLRGATAIGKLSPEIRDVGRGKSAGGTTGALLRAGAGEIVQ